MHDAHYHYSKEINALQNEYDISGICNVANEKEFELVQQKHLFYSCGVHPWNASLDTLNSMFPLLKKAYFSIKFKICVKIWKLKAHKNALLVFLCYNAFFKFA